MRAPFNKINFVISHDTFAIFHCRYGGCTDPDRCGNGDFTDLSKLDIHTRSKSTRIKKAANTYSWGTHRPWAARGTGGTFQCDIRRRCAGAWARTDIRRAIWDWESPRPRAADSRCRARSLDAPPASRPDAKIDGRQRLLCWSSMKADLPLWETGVLDVVLSPPLPPGGPGVTEPRPA
ncbi:hypothetical protein ALC62_02689 [Cyphomyrmex costatus]|uniref:Uncharacterized protein n=1 Tax=Cyphomyrmex costatus TaxID=456900 RepID=A0A195D0F4_9HYME|nr:hypothetical protein ALC62_02689 [Cyphomyrmex costatus]